MAELTELRTKELVQKWKPILEHEKLPKIRDSYKKQVTAILLENQEKFLKKQVAQGAPTQLLTETPANQAGAGLGYVGNPQMQGYDPVLISMLRRAVPNLIAFDICGVQPMNAPTGMVFYLKARYGNQSGAEAQFDEAITTFSSKDDAPTATHTPLGDVLPQANANALSTGRALQTAEGEALGNGVDPDIAEMAFSIERVVVEAGTRKLAAGYTFELAQDLQAVHGINARDELSRILSTELLAEINREVVRIVYNNAVPGAQHNVDSAGTFNLDIDSNGRWMVERFKGLMFQLEREANAIAKATRRGRGNIIITSSDVASALTMAGKLDVFSNLQDNLNVDDTGNTFVGVLNGKYKVFVDPYVPVSANNYFVVGYKGSIPYDAGLFYCPYVPLQMVQAMDPRSFQPRMGFQTRYGMIANPFATPNGVVGNAAFNQNIYYRKVNVANLQ
jgi:hypothetical protein